MGGKRGDWTTEQVATLVRLYHQISDLDALAEQLDKSVNAVYLKANRLGLKRDLLDEYVAVEASYVYAMKALDDWISYDGTLEAIITIVQELKKIYKDDHGELPVR